MKILRHQLHDTSGEPIKFKKSFNIGKKIIPEYLVIHYTAGGSAEGAIDWLTRRDTNVSAHVVIARNGDITQLVPFDRMAFHAGYSRWEGRVGLNAYSIGIELDNAGLLKRHGSRWKSYFDRYYEEDEVIEAIHKYNTHTYGWHIFPQVQINAAQELGILLFNKYNLLDVVGHDDISPKRKWDPGPAFPMHNYRSRVIGRAISIPPLYETITTLNIRSGPGSSFQPIPGSPLPAGTKLELVDKSGSWWLVDVLESLEGISDIQGWIHHRYVRRIRTST